MWVLTFIKGLESLPMSSICSQCSETGLLNELTRILLLPTMRQSQRQVPCWCLSMAKVSPLQLISLTESRALLCLFCWLLSSPTVLPMASAHIRLSDPLFPYRSVIADHGLLSNYAEGNDEKKGKKQQTANPFRFPRTALSEETGRPLSTNHITKEWPDLPLYFSLFSLFSHI